ncbi:autophagy- protein 2 [Linnemannia exigua]|uniref:Autophagy-related protein 2 n=1 Tax=Linnemannia exigua TaxID=604196 RepID=A0AAD4DCL1_9FUNG|nr:autophagy- protein 2 [Linnemannia exigua]
MKAWSFGNLFSSLAVPAGLQKRLVSFLLQRAIGHFLEDSLDLEKLDIELSNGIVHLTDLRLNSKVLNELVAGTPLAVTKGRIGSITATIPWRNLWNGQCVLEIDGIDVTLAPVQATQSGHLQNLEEQLLSASVDLASDFIQQSSSVKEEAALRDSILQSLQAQVQAAQAPTGIPGDFNYRPSNQPSSPLLPSGDSTSPTGDLNDASEGEGVQFVAKLIEKLMARIQIICRGTTIRLQHSSSLQLINPQSGSSNAESLDYELEIRLPYIAYRDETPGWDQSTTGREPSSMAASTVYGAESTSGSTMLEDSVLPSVIWQDTPESIKTVTFKGFSIWIRQKGGQDDLLATVDPTPLPTPLPSEKKEALKSSPGDAADDDQSMSDSDSDVFTDAQENFSQSMMASRIIPRPIHAPTPPPAASTPVRSTRPIDQSRLYQAEILSTLQHKNRVKVNIRKNAAMLPGPNSTQAPSTIKSLLDIDFSIKSIFVALSPNQIAFLLEILSLMDHAPPAAPNDSPKQNAVPVNLTGTDRESRDELSRLRDRTTSRGSTLRSDSTPERSSSIHNQRPMSPKQRSPPVDLLRAPHTRSPGGPTQEPDKYVDSRNSRTTIPTPAAFLDSSRFLSGSTYSEHRAGSTTPSGAASGTSTTLTVKLKAKVGIFQVFILYQDPRSLSAIPTEANFFKSPTPEALGSGHLKLELDSMVLKYQQWALPSATAGGQKLAKQNKGQVDFTLSNFAIAEWIDAAPKPYDTRHWDTKSDRYRLPPRKAYIPIVEFDAGQDSLYQVSSNSKFPTLRLPRRYMTERSKAARTKSSTRPLDKPSPPHAFSEPQGISRDPMSLITKEVIRMRVVLGGKKDSQNQSTLTPDVTQTANSMAHVRDVTIEVKPLHVHVDLFMFQRLEKVLLALMASDNKPESSSSHVESTSDHSAKSPRGIEQQQIIDDLDGSRKTVKPSTRVRLRLNSIQVWVSVPDMALALAEQVDTGPEYRSIYDVIALNISKLVVTNALDSSLKGSSPAQPNTSPGVGGRDDNQGSKLKVEFACVSAFVIPAHETSVRALLMVGPLLNHPGTMSGFNSSLPSLEIVSRTASSIPQHYERTPPSTFPRVPALQAFAILEAEENVHNAADEEEELLHFKHRTIETSLLLIDAHLPLLAVHLEKHILDNLQLRINDMSTWATLFSEKLASQLPASPETPKVEITSPQERPLSYRFDDFKEGQRNSLDGGFRDDQSEHGTDQSTAYGEELRHQAEGNPSLPRIRTSRDFQFPARLVRPTLASVVLFAQTVDVILDYPTKPTVLDPVPIIKSYQINAGEARIFAGAKYQGGTDTYVTIDAEDLEFWEITAQKPKALLLKRTIPKNVKVKAPKPMFHMTSLLSFDPVVKFKENDTNLAFNGISWKFSVDQTAVDDVQDFFAEPEGIVYLNPPHQCTRISVALGECGMDYKPLHIPSRFVLTFEKMKVFSTLIPESPTLKSKVQIYNMYLFLIDYQQSILSPQFPTLGSSGSGIDSRRFWSALGFAQIGECPFFELRSVKSKNGQLPLYDLSITNQMFYLDTCSDSFETLSQFAAYMGDNGDMPMEKKLILERLAEAERATNRAMSNVIYQDILVASLDEDAFRKPKQDKDLADAGTLEFVEGFYAIERDDTENDYFKAQIQDSPDVDGFHEVYADLLQGSRRSGHNGGTGSSTQDGGTKSSTKGKGSKSKSKAQTLAPTRTGSTPVSQLQSLTIPSPTKTTRSSLDGGRRDETGRKLGHTKKESVIEDILRILDPEATFSIVENHFSIPVLTEEEKAKDEGSLAKMRVRIRDFNFSWRLYDGLDWEISRLDETERKKQARQFAKRLYDPNDDIHSTMDTAQSNLEASIFECLSGMQPGSADRQGHDRRDFSPCSSEADSTSDYQNDVMSQASGAGGRPSSTSSNSGSRRSNHHQGRHSHSTNQGDPSKRKKKLERSKTAMVEFNADRVRVDFEDHVSGVETASHLSVRVREFEIIDNLKTSHWHKFLSHQRHDSSSTNPRSAQSNMVRIDLDGVRPVDALMFLIKFFVQGTGGGGGGSSGAGDTQPEGMAAVPDNVEKKKPNEMYFQSVRLGEISVKMDYKPKHVDYTGLSGGNFVELMNFFHLDAAEMTLQEVRLHGINGFTKMGQDLVAAWLPHIRSTQVPNMVSGLTPIRSLVNLGSGIADLVLLPIEQYKRDGHIIRGLQKGGQAFTRATTLEALKIGAKLAVGTQVLLEHADEIFGSGAGATSGHGGKSITASRGAGVEGDDDIDPYNSNNSGKRMVATMVTDSEAYMQESIDDEDQLLQHLHYQQQQQQQLEHQHYLQSIGHGTSSSALPTSGGGPAKQGSSNSAALSRVSKYANQPADINEGMELAYKSLSKNIGTAAHTIFAVPMEVYERTGAQGSVRAVIRAVPVAVLKPMIGATEAFSKVLIGIRNSIDPVQRLQNEDKYKRH